MFPRILAAILVVALLGAVAPCSAQSYKKGDEIEVQVLGDWVPGFVVQTNPRGDVLAEYEWIAGRTQQKVFKAQEVRFAYESGAIARARMWSDASGKFKIKAALIDLSDDNVTLRKPDKTEVTIAVDKLSDGDRSFLKKLTKSVGPIPPKLPEVVVFEDASVFGDAGWGSPVRAALEPDPVPAGLRMKQGGLVLPRIDFFDRLGAVLPLGGSDAWVLAAMDNESPKHDVPTRLLWSSLAKSKLQGQQALPPGEVVMDYHTKSKQLLTLSTDQFKGNVEDWGTSYLTLWSVLPTDSQAKPIVRWRVNVGAWAPN